MYQKFPLKSQLVRKYQGSAISLDACKSHYRVTSTTTIYLFVKVSLMNKFVITQKLLKAGVVATFSAVGTAMLTTGQEHANSMEPEVDSDTTVNEIHYSNEESIQREHLRLMSPEIDYKVSWSRNFIVNVQQSNNTNGDWTRTYKSGNLGFVAQPEQILY